MGILNYTVTICLQFDYCGQINNLFLHNFSLYNFVPYLRSPKALPTINQQFTIINFINGG